MPHKFNDLGKMEESLDLPGTKSDSKKVKSFPSLHLFDKVPDELFELDLGKEFRAEIIFKVRSKGKDERSTKEGKKARKDMALDIQKIKVVGKNKMTKEEFKNASDEERNEESERLLNV